MVIRTLARWTVRSLQIAALTASLAGSAATAFAQNTLPASSPSAGPKRTFTKNTTFNLPIQMDDRVRATLSQVQLYVKSGPGDWVRQEAVTPQTPHFTYRVPQDGEYWFALVTVDKAGKASPSDVSTATPALRVVVDTRPPVLETSIALEANEPVLRVNIIDANPDIQSLRAVVLTEQGDRALQPLQGPTVGFRLSQSDLHLPIRITAADLSGNLTTKELPGRDPAMARAGNLPVNQASNTTALPALSTLPPVDLSSGTQPALFNPPVQAVGSVNSAAYRPVIDNGERPDRKIINTTHASIDYRIDKSGPSGVGRVDVYLSTDTGKNWSKIAEDLDKQSPAEIDLPGEGIFGIRLSVINGNGFGGKAPKSGDRPSFFIEVDATSPIVQLNQSEMVAGSGAFNIRWAASDNNLGPEPVSIFYRTQPSGAWLPVTARGIKNDGVFRWAFPRDIGPQFFLKLEVVDLAGNVTKVETPTPILLDLSEPEATLVDVTGVQQRGPMNNVPAAPGRN